MRFAEHFAVPLAETDEEVNVITDLSEKIRQITTDGGNRYLTAALLPGNLYFDDILSYGAWLHQLQTILVYKMRNTLDADGMYTMMHIGKMNAYPNDENWCYQHRPERVISESLRPTNFRGCETNRLVIRQITRGQAYIDKLMEAYAAHRTCKTIETLLTSQRGQRVVIVKTSDTSAVIYTNRIDEDFIQKAFIYRTAIFPHCAILNAEDSPTYALSKAVCEKDINAIYEQLKSFNEEVEAILKEAVWTRIQEIMGRKKKAMLKDIKRNIDRIERDLEHYEQTYRSLLSDAQTNKQRYTALLTEPDATADALKEAITTMKNVELVGADTNGALKIQIDTPIANYRLNDVRFWYKNNNNNYVTVSPIAKVLIDAIFNKDEPEYMLHTRTIISIPLVTDGYWERVAQPENHIANPHIKHYACFRASQLEATKALNRQDYVTAFSILTAACGTITFTDSAVVQRFVGDLELATAKENQQPCIEVVATGEMLTPAQLYEKLTNPEHIEDIEEELVNAPD